MYLDNFIALDIETANRDRGSICEIGISVFTYGKHKFSNRWLVRPSGNEYETNNIRVHGITPAMTIDKPMFPEVWEKISCFFDNRLVVSHNSSFDMYSLADCLSFYKIPFPRFDYFCTLRCSKIAFPGLDSYSLDNLCKFHDIPLFSHHSAKYDARACGELFLKIISQYDEKNSDTLAAALSIRPGRFDDGIHTPQSSIRNYSFDSSPMSTVKTPTKEKLEESFGNYFNGKNVCFTGSFMLAQRRDLLQAIADVGGIPTDSVTKKTDILIVGQQDFRVVGDEGMSSKQKKALALIEKGHDIEIMSEDEFLTKYGGELLGKNIAESLYNRLF